MWLLCATVDSLASLQLAVLLILAMAAVLGLATFVEARFGTPAAHFGIYGSGWFEALNAMLAVNIFFAAAVRYPWKRYQTGFVITHIGLLTLLYGCYLARRGGIDAQIPIKEGRSNNVFYEDPLFVRIDVSKSDAAGAVPLSAKEQQEKDASIAAGTAAGVERIDLPVAVGPFNWSEYSDPQHALGAVALNVGRAFRQSAVDAVGDLGRATWEFLTWSDGGAPVADPAAADEVARRGSVDWAWPLFSAAKRDVGPISDPRLAAAGVQVELVDFYSASVRKATPNLTLSMRFEPKEGPAGHGMEGMPKGAASESPVEFAIQSIDDKMMGAMQGFHHAERQMLGGGSIGFWMVPSYDAVQAFLAKPDAKTPGFGDQGQVVFWAGGEAHRFRVQDHVGKEAFPLGKSGWTAKIARAEEVRLGRDSTVHVVDLHAVSPEGKTQRLAILAERPEMSAVDPNGKIFASYWIDQSGLAAADVFAGKGGSRVDIIQGPAAGLDPAKPESMRLYYRRWNRAEVVEAGLLPTDGLPFPAFEMSRATVTLRLASAERDYIASVQPGDRVVGLPFDKKTAGAFPRAAKLRLSIAGKASEEVWVEEFGRNDDVAAQASAEPGAPAAPRPRTGQVVTKVVDGKKYEISLRPQQIAVGYQIRCDQFEKKMDPGSESVRHYGCQIDFLDPANLDAKPPEHLRDVKIGMNAPIDFHDPASGRSYRLFQESYRGPVRDVDGVERYITFLTVNYNPGRGVQYLGSLLIVLGIMTMFYMKAYFFKPIQRKATAASPQGEAASAAPPTEPAREAVTASSRPASAPPKKRRR